jgi:CIC family chloride channel protein
MSPLHQTRPRVISSEPPAAPDPEGWMMRLRRRLRSLARRFLLLTIVVIGAMCGVLAVLFHRYVEVARAMLIGPALSAPEPWRSLLVLATPAIVFTFLAWCIRRFAPRAVGANLARVRIAYNSDPEAVGPRSVAATFLATPLSLGAGAPLGPEGPIVVITSGASAAVARMLQLPRRLVRGMIPVGVAAGIAAIFNTPITGVVFALEEVFGSAERGLLGGVIVGAVSAAVVERALLGGRPVLAAPFTTWHDARELIGFAVIGLLAGIVSGYAIAITHRLKRKWAEVMPSMLLRTSLAGLLIGALGLIAPSILGVGYDTVSLWLHGGGSTEQTAIAFGAKTLAFIVALSAGILGGTFAPSLFMGAALGAAIGQIAQRMLPTATIDPRAYALLGMGAFFAGLLRSPIAAVLIVVELTRDYELMIPLMLAVSLSVAVSRRISPHSMVEQQMIDEGYIEANDAADPLANVRVTDAMTPNPISVRADVTLLDATRAIAGTRHRVYPVTDDDGTFLGVLSREVIEKAARENCLDRVVRDSMEQPKLVAVATELVVELVRRMQYSGADRSPVIDDEQSRKIVGFVSPADILRIRIRQLPAEEESPFEIFE